MYSTLIYILFVAQTVNPRSEVPLVIRIDDENDNPPTFTQMIVLPDHGIYVTKDEAVLLDRVKDWPTFADYTTERSVDTASSESLAVGGVRTTEYNRSPLVFVPENVTIGTVIIRFLARDKDNAEADNGAAITYSLTSDGGEETASTASPRVKSNSDSRPYFVIGPRSGELSVARALPAGREIRLGVTASDIGNLTDRLTLRIFVEDVNDHPPIFKKTWYAFDVPEGVYEARVIGTIEALDADIGTNANVTYEIDPTTSPRTDQLSFDIGRHDGSLTVSGNLDREIRDSYRFCVIASDNGAVPLSSRVDLEINVLDVNDNAPVFHGYAEIDRITEEPDGGKKSGDVGATPGRTLPIYYASVPEDSPVGSVVAKVYANDTDFVGNGNGLILFDIPHAIGDKQYMTIDGKDGLVTIIADLDYERVPMHNLTITARDLGSPSLTSTAMLYVRVLDVDEVVDPAKPTSDEKPVFQHRYYEVEVEENSPVPMKILRLNVSDRYVGERTRFAIASDDIEIRDRFSVDPNDGTLYLLKSLDREVKDLYEVRVKVDRIDKTGRGLGPVQIYPVPSDRLAELASNEAKILVRVKDSNDNAPRFKSKGRPLLAAVPTSAPYGYEIIRVEVSTETIAFTINSTPRAPVLLKIMPEVNHFGNGGPKGVYELMRLYERVHSLRQPPVSFRRRGRTLSRGAICATLPAYTRTSETIRNRQGRSVSERSGCKRFYALQAEDPDEGANGEIRYQILGREDAPRFAIDPLSGQVRSVGSFSRDAGRVFGFDVKATDCRGAENGRSSIANVFVSTSTLCMLMITS